MARPTTLQEKKLYQDQAYLNTETLEYILTDPYEYLEDYPGQQFIETLIVKDHPLSSGVGLSPDTYNLKLKSDGTIKQISITGSNLAILDAAGSPIVEGFLPSSGGALTGYLDLHADPVQDLQAATKQYVDSVSDDLAGYLPISGGTLTGPLGVNGLMISGALLTLSGGRNDSGLLIKCSDDSGFVLHIEDFDGTVQMAHMDHEGYLGLGTVNPQYGLELDHQGHGADFNTINLVNGFYRKEGVEIHSFAQADFTTGTDIDTERVELAINTGSAMTFGSGFTVNATNITIANPGYYKVHWSCCAYLPNTARDRKTMLTELNQNSGTYLSGTLQGGYVRDGAQSGHANTGGTYYIQTTTANETIGLRARMYGDTGQTFEIAGGFISVELVEID